MIRAINLSGEIPENRELRVILPADIPIGPAEMVLVVSLRASPKAATLGEFLASEFVGMWSDREDIGDSGQFARDLRVEGWKRPA